MMIIFLRRLAHLVRRAYTTVGRLAPYIHALQQTLLSKYNLFLTLTYETEQGDALKMRDSKKGKECIPT